jgi:Fe-S oxidoreductase/nitrate reductase gamma subunit
VIERVPYEWLAPLLFVVAAVYFSLAMSRHLRVFAAVQPSHPFDRLPERAMSVAVHVFGQVRMFRDVRPALMHLAIFYGFLAITVISANYFSFGLVQVALSWPLDGVLWRIAVFGQNVISVLVIVAIVYALVRRLVIKPRRLTLSTDALVILLLIGGVVTSGLLADAYLIAGHGDPYGGAAVASNYLTGWLVNMPVADLDGGFAVYWWSHALLVAAFLAYLPRSKHLHIVTSPFNVFFRKLEPRGQLPLIDLEKAESFGIKALPDLGWKDVLDGFTCTECGRCQEACPAWAVGKVLNPKTFIMGIRDMAVDAEAGMPLIPEGEAGRLAGLASGPQPEAFARPIVDMAIPYEAVWDCVTCGACVEACPVLIEHVDKIVGLRRSMVLEESRFPSELTVAMRNMESHGNPWGVPRSQRLDWARGLPFDVPLASDLLASGRSAAGGLPQIEVLYWVGCAAAFDERNRKVARALVTCLAAAGVSFAVLGQDETCSGDPARRMGNEYLFQLFAQENVATLQRYDPPEIVATCPHCFNTILNEYPQFGGSFRVTHHTQYLARLAESGRLQPGEGVAATLTYHDPCYLTRYNGVEAEPRSAFGAVPGLAMVEMEKHGRGTFCCGAGGGRMWMEEPAGKRVNAARTKQALATGAEVVGTACPFCLVMMRDGLADAPEAAERGVRALDIAEVMADSLVR